MTIFLILSPYIAFGLLSWLAPAAISVFAAAAICLVTIAIEVARGRSVKILAAGSALLFTAIGIYLTLVDPALSALAVKVSVDAGILAIMLGSILLGSPFTRQYALEEVDAETARLPAFIRANYVITAAWSAAALVMLASNVLLLYVPGLPIWASLAVAFAARNGAIAFTRWYPDYQKLKYAVSFGAPTQL